VRTRPRWRSDSGLRDVCERSADSVVESCIQFLQPIVDLIKQVHLSDLFITIVVNVLGRARPLVQFPFRFGPALFPFRVGFRPGDGSQFLIEIVLHRLAQNWPNAQVRSIPPKINSLVSRAPSTVGLSLCGYHGYLIVTRY